MLIALMVLVLVGCGESYTSRNTVATRSTEKSPFGFTPTPPEPTPTPNPLASVIRKYMSAVEQFQADQVQLAGEHKASVASVIARAAVYPQSWKAEFSEILIREVQLVEKWENIEPPEAFLGFHETYARGLSLFVERHNLLTSWLDTFDGNEATQSAPWEQDTAIANDQLRVYNVASDGWFYAASVYPSLIVRPTPTVRPRPAPTVQPSRASRYSKQIAALSTMTNCSQLNIHWDLALDFRLYADTEFEMRDADAYKAAASRRLIALCD